MRAIRVALFAATCVLVATPASAYNKGHHKALVGLALDYMAMHGTPPERAALTRLVGEFFGGDFGKARDQLGAAAYEVDGKIEANTGGIALTGGSNPADGSEFADHTVFQGGNKDGWLFNQLGAPICLPDGRWVGAHAEGDQMFTSMWHFMNLGFGTYKLPGQHEGFSYVHRFPAMNEELTGPAGLFILPDAGPDELLADYVLDDAAMVQGTWAANYRQGGFTPASNWSSFSGGMIFEPADNAAFYHYMDFLYAPGPDKIRSLGHVLHFVQDIMVPHHVHSTNGNFHGPYETWAQDHMEGGVASKYLGSTPGGNIEGYKQWVHGPLYDLGSLGAGFAELETRRDLRALMLEGASRAFAETEFLTKEYSGHPDEASKLLQYTIKLTATVITKAMQEKASRSTTVELRGRQVASHITAALQPAPIDLYINNRYIDRRSVAMSLADGTWKISFNVPRMSTGDDLTFALRRNASNVLPRLERAVISHASGPGLVVSLTDTAANVFGGKKLDVRWDLGEEAAGFDGLGTSTAANMSLIPATGTLTLRAVPSATPAPVVTPPAGLTGQVVVQVNDGGIASGTCKARPAVDVERVSASGARQWLGALVAETGNFDTLYLTVAGIQPTDRLSVNYKDGAFFTCNGVKAAPSLQHVAFDVSGSTVPVHWWYSTGLFPFLQEPPLYAKVFPTIAQHVRWQVGFPVTATKAPDAFLAPPSPGAFVMDLSLPGGDTWLYGLWDQYKQYMAAKFAGG